ncbi:hypothetical protein WICMUC_002778 [Wickerhamomyces mucosus]|uniref:Peptidase S59 domain-containing protein n=1 Tax=Wickerhamomyces mucosus TaxID=1378264 RepID=A0A9P8PN30_9ASCO|nr:hypothetical protein WICMUC_002778 [Wickerhamomyces mucosus]
MFGSNNTFGSGFGTNSNNSNSNGGALFGNKMGSTTGFGGIGSSNNTPSSSSNLFGNNNGASTQASGGLFGNSNARNNATTSSNTTGGLFGNSPGNSQSTGGLFGNTTNNTQSAGGLFGGKPAATTSTFGNSTNSQSSTGGLFGNNQSVSSPSTGGLFGNNNSITAKTPLFGNNSTSQTSSGGLFGSNSQANQALNGSIGAYSSVNSSNSLFGNSNGNVALNTTPVKQYNFKDLPKSLTDSTKANKIINHPGASRKRSLSSSSSSAIHAPNDLLRSSLIKKLGTRFSSVKVKTGYNAEGLFSPKKDVIQSVLSPERDNGKSKILANKLQRRTFSTSYIIPSAVGTARSSSTDYLKLKVDPSRSEARKLKIFGQSGGAQKMRILGRDDEGEEGLNPINEGVEYRVTDELGANGSSLYPEIKQQSQLDPESKDNGIVSNDKRDDKAALSSIETDYWCSPSIEELSKLQLRQLAEISGFTIGRKGYGTIWFQQPVDLTSFWSDLPGNLFGNIVNFNKNKTVEVYPNGSVPQGTGLNVPAVITIEKVFPVSRTKDTQSSANSKDLQIRLFTRKLQEQRDMEFITYDPINGSWTFKVKHFSIWGLIDEDDAVVDVDLNDDTHSDVNNERQEKNQHTDLRLKPDQSLQHNHPQPSERLQEVTSTIEEQLLLKRQKDETRDELDSSVNIPGSFIADDSPYGKRQNLDTDDIILETKSISSADIESEIGIKIQESRGAIGFTLGNESFDVSDVGEEVDAKHFEPLEANPEDFEVLDADPKVDIADNWDTQLELASELNSAYADDSLFNKTTIYNAPFSTAPTPGEIDKLLYGDFNIVSKDLKSVTHENTNASENNLDEISKKIHVEKSPKSVFETSSITDIEKQNLLKIYSSHLKVSNLMLKSNFPQVVKNPNLQFQFLVSALNKAPSDAEQDIWKLSSILFDSQRAVESISDVAVSNKILDSNRREGLISWLKNQIQGEINVRYDSLSDPFEKIFTLLLQSKIPEASKLAINTKNPHLAVLISLLGSNDPDVKEGADRQLIDWKRNSILQTIPEGLLKIYYLLKGDNILTNIQDDFSWKCKLTLLLSYGDLNQPLALLLSNFIKSNDKFIPKEDQVFYNLIKLYVFKHNGEFKIDEIFSSIQASNITGIRLQWYLYEVLIRSTNQLSFGGGHELGRKLTLSFAEQLKNNGFIEESIFILLHLNDSENSKTLITKIINSNISKLGDKQLKTLIESFKIPQEIIYEAKALYFKSAEDHWNEASSLLDAGLYDEAHTAIISTIAPEAIINNGHKLGKLENLILRFPKDKSVKKWSTGLGVYKSYLKFLKSQNESSLRYLIDNVPLVVLSNFKINIAIKLISKMIATELIKKEKIESMNGLDLHVDKILKLPLTEGDSQYFGNQIKPTYLKEKLLAQS